MEQPGPVDVTFRMFDLIPNGVIVLNSAFTVCFWNTRMAEWTGILPEQVEGTNLVERYPTLNDPSVLARITQLFEGGPAVLFSPMFHPHLIPCSLPNGNLRAHKMSFIPMNYHNEIYALVFVEDVSDLTGQVKAYRDMKKIADRQLEEIKKAQNAIYLANKKLNLLNSITRHDIMNKLTVLIGYLELSRDREHKDPEIIQYLDHELEAAEAIKDHIQFTRFYQDIGVKSSVWQDLPVTIRTSIISLDMQKVLLTIDLPDIEIFADPLLQKVFYTLVENSLRHGETITAVRFSCSESEAGLSIICEDDGIGVPVEVKEKIFRREFFKHTGFGLFLTREILAITHLSICENGVPEKGARFEITVPTGMYRFKSKIQG
jgi:signal transduction histidine kinase